MIKGIGNFTINFKNSHTIYETVIKCKVKEREFNTSYNKSLRINPNSFDGIIDDKFLTENFQPYVTTIGLYNDKLELVAIAKFQQPIPMSKTTDMVFEIRFDN
jgi:hypothetical protein